MIGFIAYVVLLGKEVAKAMVSTHVDSYSYIMNNGMATTTHRRVYLSLYYITNIKKNVYTVVLSTHFVPLINFLYIYICVTNWRNQLGKYMSHETSR